MNRCPSYSECHVRSGSDNQCDWHAPGYCIFPHSAVEGLFESVSSELDSNDDPFSESYPDDSDFSKEDDKTYFVSGV